MKMKVKVGISNRHIHLTKEVYDKLFEEELTVKKNLNQKGEFAAIQTLTIKKGEKEITNVRVMGPFRTYNQLEISLTDAKYLHLNPPVRESGNLQNSEAITLKHNNNEITLDNICILAKRHLHISEEEALKYGLKQGDKVKVIIFNPIRGGSLDAYVKVSKNGNLELHLDTDEANAFLLNNGDEVEIEF